MEATQSRADTEQWTDLGALAELEGRALRTVRADGHQLVVGRDASGAWFVLDNRCPHEGYPLAQGELKGDALTCCWHNWKFDVRDGACLLGGEGVRRFPVRERAGRLEADLAPLPPERLFPGLLAGLREGLSRYDNGRAIRDGVRLLQAGFEPLRLVLEVARHDALHAEYGSTHVLALASDAARLLDEREGLDAMYAIAPLIDLCGETNRRLPRRARPEPVRPYGAAEYRAAVADERAAEAEGMVLAAFADGAPRAEVEAWMFGAVADHFTSFGHELIYLVKCQDLLARAASTGMDAEYAPDLYAALTCAVVLGTREDTLPYWEPYVRRWKEVEGELEALAAGARADAEHDADALSSAVVDGTPAEAVGALVAELRRGVPAPRIARTLVAAAAERLLRFDLAIDADPELAETWLWATHRFTFASAMRNAVERTGGADALRYLFQAVGFVGSGRPMDAAPGQRLEPVARDADASAVVAAIAARDPAAAVDAALGYLGSGAPIAPLRAALLELCLSDPLVRPIVVTHAIKTTTAAFEELDALEGHPRRATALLAAVRFLASPVVERRVRQAVDTSIRWVAEGLVPRKLTQ